VFGLIGVVIALVVLTIALAGLFLVRPSITVGATGKILAFVSLCVLPVLCISTGMSFHMQRSQQTSSCISCHSMASHGQSLHLEDPKYIPAQHFQNHFVPPDKACYTCHTDYTIYGPWKSRIDGLRYVYMTYIGAVPKTIHLKGKYSNLQCLHCHAGARDFEEHLNQMPPIGDLTSNRISCLSSGCHDMIHNASEVGRLRMWNGGATSTGLASGASTPAPAKAEPGATTGPSKAGSTAGGARSAVGKAVFDSHGCSGCHGESGVGGSGPALTHVSSQYPPAKLTAVLKAPTAKMKAAGMVPLTLSAADMKGLVSYVSGLGGTAASAATPSSPGASAPAPAKAEPVATAGTSKTPGSAAGSATTAGGKGIFDSHGCTGCHGESGAGGSGPALTDVSSKYPPAKLTAVLEAPTAGMNAAGMVPLTLSAADMKELVSYVTSLGGTSASAAPLPSPGAPSTAPAPAEAEPDATAGTSNVKTGSSASDATTALGKSLYHSHGCGPCHGATGTGGAGSALTHISGQYPPAKLTAILKAPTAGMKAAGMIPVTLNAADMEALVSYVTSLGGASVSASPPASAASTPAPAKSESDSTTGASKAPTGDAAGIATAAGGKGVFDSQGCAGCHGESGAGGSGPALTHISSQYSPAKLTAILKAPTPSMKAAGMVPVTLNAADMKALVSYVSSLEGK
jgi:mono/diheme cytochrome c family protein